MTQQLHCLSHAILISLLLATSAAGAATMADELLVLERSVRDVPQSAEATLSQAQTESFRMLGRKPKAPMSPGEAIAVSIKISTALARSNFLQPVRREDWVSTLGEAFVPHSLAAAELDALLAYPGNSARAPFVARDKPVFLVDCDIGSLLIISVATHFGWDVRLVEVPDHNFVRWHLPDGRTVNWDWTDWKSQADIDYLPNTPAYEVLRQRGIYLRSFGADEARAYYVGLIGSKAKPASAGTPLLELALKSGARDPTTYNNLAWNYVTQRDVAQAKSEVAMMHALTAWSARPDDGNTVDTVACAFAAAGTQALALALEDYAAAQATSAKQREGFQRNRERMAAGDLCQ